MLSDVRLRSLNGEILCCDLFEGPTIYQKDELARLGGISGQGYDLPLYFDNNVSHNTHTVARVAIDDCHLILLTPNFWNTDENQ
jgi:hypothetical protein